MLFSKSSSVNIGSVHCLFWQISIVVHDCEKRYIKKFITPYSNLFLSVLYQNKALNNFYERRHGPKA